MGAHYVEFKRENQPVMVAVHADATLHETAALVSKEPTEEALKAKDLFDRGGEKPCCPKGEGEHKCALCPCKKNKVAEYPSCVADGCLTSSTNPKVRLQIPRIGVLYRVSSSIDGLASFNTCYRALRECFNAERLER